MEKVKEVIIYRKVDHGIRGVFKPIKAVGKLEQLSNLEKENISKIIQKFLPDYVLEWTFFSGPGRSYAYRDNKIEIIIGKTVRCGKNTIVVEAYVDYDQNTSIKYIYLVHNDKALLLCQTHAGLFSSLYIREVVETCEGIVVHYTHMYNRRCAFSSMLVKLSEL